MAAAQQRGLLKTSQAPSIKIQFYNVTYHGSMMPFLSKFFDKIIVANETHRHNHAQLIILSVRKPEKKSEFQIIYFTLIVVSLFIYHVFRGGKL